MSEKLNRTVYSYAFYLRAHELSTESNTSECCGMSVRLFFTDFANDLSLWPAIVNVYFSSIIYRSPPLLENLFIAWWSLLNDSENGTNRLGNGFFFSVSSLAMALSPVVGDRISCLLDVCHSLLLWLINPRTCAFRDGCFRRTMHPIAVQFHPGMYIALPKRRGNN